MEEYSKIAKCLYCGKEFERTNKRHKYCSGRCKEAYRLSKLELHKGVCKGCGKEITYKLKAGKPTKQYCCAACQLAHTVPTKILTCVDCGKQFEFHGRTTKLRCDDCWHKHRSKSVMAERALRDPTVRIGVGSGGGQNTETTISDEARVQTNARRRAYYAANAEKMREAARSRYRAKVMTGHDVCEICGFADDQDALVVHHKDMDRTNNDISNLAIICANCHMVLHKMIKQMQKTEQVTATAIFELCKERAELKERNEAGKADKLTRTEGCEESQSGATHSDTSSSDMSHHEAAPEVDGWDVQPDLGF